jgi:hypothetical protein
MLSAIFENNRIKNEQEDQYVFDNEGTRESDKEGEPLEEPEDKYTPEFIKSLTQDDIDRKLDEMIYYSDIKKIQMKTHRGNMHNLTGEVNITFTEDPEWTHCYCELKNGLFHGVVGLYDGQGNCQRGVWIYQEKENLNFFVKGDITKDDTSNCGTFVKVGGIYYLHGDNCELTSTKYGANFKGKFNRGMFIEGTYSLGARDITFENSKGIIGKIEESEYTSIGLPDSSAEILCVLRPLNGIVVISEIISIIFDNGCHVLWKNKKHRSSLQEADIRENICITNFHDATFTLGRYFKSKNIIDLDVFTFKCFLLANFKCFPSQFFEKYTNYRLTNNVLHSMDEEQYKDLGLNSLQIKLMNDKILEMGSSKK